MLWRSLAFARPLRSLRLIPPRRDFKSKPTAEEDDPDAPVVYSTSKASQWKASDTLRAPEHMRNVPPIQQYSVLLSTAVFMLYFFILREENDIDEKLYQPLEKTIPNIDQTSWGQSRLSKK